MVFAVCHKKNGGGSIYFPRSHLKTFPAVLLPVALADRCPTSNAGEEDVFLLFGGCLLLVFVTHLVCGRCVV